MLIPLINRHLAICGVGDVQPILRRDPAFWNLISIYDPTEPAPHFTGAKRIHRSAFFDVEDTLWAADVGCAAPRIEDIESIFRIIDGLPGEPLLIHCRAGVSRSTAVALALIIRGDVNQACVDEAVTQLLALRPRAVPNGLVLRLAFGLFMPPEDAIALTAAIARDPRLVRNRGANPNRQ